LIEAAEVGKSISVLSEPRQQGWVNHPYLDGQYGESNMCLLIFPQAPVTRRSAVGLSTLFCIQASQCCVSVSRAGDLGLLGAILKQKVTSDLQSTPKSYDRIIVFPITEADVCVPRPEASFFPWTPRIVPCPSRPGIRNQETHRDSLSHTVRSCFLESAS